MAGAIGWGILGTGVIARRFAADLALLPDARLAAVFSRAAERAEAFGAEFGAGAAYAELAALLADPAVDIVYVATPNALHAEQASLALAAGRPALVEKPFALSAADAERVAAQAAEKKLFVMEALWTRFLPAAAAARKWADEGAIGTITRVTADLSYDRPEGPGRLFDPALGGGAAYDLGVYPLSLALFFLGPPEAVSGNWRAARSGVDKRAEFALSWPGATAALSCGFDREGANFFLIEGTKGAIRLEPPFLGAKRVSRFTPAALASPAGRLSGSGLLARAASRLPWPGRRAARFPFPGGGLQFEAAAAMAALREGRTGSSVVPMAHTAAVLRIIETVLAKRPLSVTASP